MPTPAIVIPSEAPPQLSQVKRALLTYDKVLLIDPGDREMMPVQAVEAAAFGQHAAVGFTYGGGINARPIGKTPAYDDYFDHLLVECRDATQQGSLQVVRTFKPLPAPPQGHVRTVFGFGPIDLGGYPLFPPLVLWLYRQLARNQELLRLAVANDPILSLPDDEIASLATGGMADWSFNNDPASPLMENVAGGESRRGSLTSIARGRLGAIVKGIGYCQVNDAEPIFGTPNYCSVLGQIATQARTALATATTDPFWTRRARTLNLAHSEYLDPDALDGLSVRELLKLRTRAWGQGMEARQRYFDSVLQLTQDVPDDEKFDREVRARLVQYRKDADEVLREQRNLRYRVETGVGVGLIA